jgi:hypothetical protein
LVRLACPFSIQSRVIWRYTFQSSGSTLTNMAIGYDLATLAQASSVLE